jgi:hypothetical protein
MPRQEVDNNSELPNCCQAEACLNSIQQRWIVLAVETIGHRITFLFSPPGISGKSATVPRTTVDPPPPRVVSMWGKMIIRGQLVELLSTLALVNSPSGPALGLRA